VQRPTPEQFAILHERLRPSLRLIGRLRDRLIQRGYTSDDPYLDAVNEAWSAMHELLVRTHYLSCGGGGGGGGGSRPGLYVRD
jgi:hypothetical protein